MMLTRISRPALTCKSLFRVSQQCLNTQAPAKASAATATAASQDLVIKSNYVSKEVPYGPEYDAIPVDVKGQQVVAPSSFISRPWPNAPQLTEESGEEVKAEGSLKKDALDAELGERDESLEDELRVWFGHDMPTINDDLKPERDNVNFPRLYRLDNNPNTRMMFIPESYFKFFHEKTGVTGPYLFLGSFGTFLISKEYLVLSDDAFNGLSLGILVAVVMKKFGGSLSEKLSAGEVKCEQGWVDWQNGMIKFLEEYISKTKELQVNSIDESVLYNAKRQNIQLQREAEYRRRLMAVFDETKRKLEYQSAVDDAKRQFSQSYMVNWIIDNVNKSITADVEKSVLGQCVSDLKTLSAKRRNVI